MPRLPLAFAFALACCLALPAAPAQEPSAPASAPSSANETGPGAKPVPASRRQTGAQAVIGTGAGAAQNRQANDRDAKNRPTGAPKPAEDPALARYGIDADSAAERDSFADVGHSRVARTLIPAFCLRLSPLRFGSQREKEKDQEAIRRLNPANACGNPHPTFASGYLRYAPVPNGRGEEARATLRKFRMVHIETRPKP